MFARGFKTWAENTAIQLRDELNLQKISPLNPRQLADHLKVRLLVPDDVQNLQQSDKSILLGKECTAWHAVTVSRNGTDLIIYNPTHSIVRQNSDLMHELSHLIIGHDASKIFISPEQQVALRQYNQDQEQEADWLSYTLLLPRAILLHIYKTKMNEDDAMKMYGVSRDLLKYRMGVTGVKLQMKRFAKAGR